MERRREALLERLASGAAAEPLGEEQRRREEHRARVGDTVPGEVARRALRGPEQARAGRREVGGGDEPAAAAEPRRLGDGVAEDALCDEHAR